MMATTPERPDPNMAVTFYLVVMEDPLCKGLVQHLPVPLLQPLGLRDLLVSRVAMEDVVVSFAGWAGPDVPLGIAAEKRVSESGDVTTRPSRQHQAGLGSDNRSKPHSLKKVPWHCHRVGV